MAKVVAGIGLSHVPSVGPAFDRGKQQDPAWKPLFDAYVPVRAWLQKLEPDVVIVVYNDHVAEFTFDRYPTFALGIADRYPIADEGFGTRPLPSVPAMPNCRFTCASTLSRRNSISRSARKWASSMASSCR